MKKIIAPLNLLVLARVLSQRRQSNQNQSGCSGDSRALLSGEVENLFAIFEKYGGLIHFHFDRHHKRGDLCNMINTLSICFSCLSISINQSNHFADKYVESPLKS